MKTIPTLKLSMSCFTKLKFIYKYSKYEMGKGPG